MLLPMLPNGLDPDLPIERPDDSMDVRVGKAMILQACRDKYRAQRREDLDPRHPAYPYVIGNRIAAEKAAKRRIDDLWKQLGRKD